jgi:3-phenylpropionate/trans-cinnamate dioxygenase ferredoxin subunit
MSDAVWTDVAAEGEVPEGESRTFSTEDEHLALCRVEGTLYAIEDTCTHDDGPLGDGDLDGHAIECPRHGARFDVRDGSVLQMPAAVPVRTFPVRVRDGRIEVDLAGGA